MESPSRLPAEARKAVPVQHPRIFCLLDPTGRLIGWNRDFEHLLSPATAAGPDGHFGRLMQAEAPDTLSAIVRDVQVSGHVERALLLQTIHGPRRYPCIWQAVWDADGALTAIACNEQPAGIHSIARTVLKLADHVQSVFWITDCESQQIIYVSPSYEVLWGRTRESLMRNPASFFDALHPDDRQRVAATYSRRALGAYEAEYRIVRPDGSSSWMHERAFAIRNAQGDVYRIAGIADDVTVRKQAEEALIAERANLEGIVAQRTRELQRERDRTSAILETLGDAVIVADMQGVIEYLNPAALALTGLQDPTTAAQQYWRPWQYAPPSSPAAQMRRAIQVGHSWRGEVVQQRADGTTYDAAITVEPLFEDRVPTQAIGFVCVLRDVTPLKEAERLKDQFVSNVSHELRTPMSLITMLTGSLEMLYDRMDDQKRQEIIGDIRQHTRILNDLIGDVLEISRIDSGRIATEQQVLDLTALARDEVANMQPLAHKERRWLQFEGQDDLPFVGNDGQIRQVMRNLINNALKYTPVEGQIRCATTCIESPLLAPHSLESCQTPVSASAETQQPEVWPGQKHLHPGRWAACRVADSGIGIGADDIAHIFERFYRSKAQGDIPGTGLGLSIAWELVQRHGGYLEVASIINKGSTFAVYLPLKEDPA